MRRQALDRKRASDADFASILIGYRPFRPRYETNGHLIEIIWDEECRVQVIDDTPRMGGGRLSDQIKEVSYVPHCHRDERAGRVV